MDIKPKLKESIPCDHLVHIFQWELYTVDSLLQHDIPQNVTQAQIAVLAQHNCHIIQCYACSGPHALHSCLLQYLAC